MNEAADSFSVHPSNTINWIISVRNTRRRRSEGGGASSWPFPDTSEVSDRSGQGDLNYSALL